MAAGMPAIMLAFIERTARPFPCLVDVVSESALKRAAFIRCIVRYTTISIGRNRPSIFQVIDGCPPGIIRKWKRKRLPGFTLDNRDKLFIPVNVIQREGKNISDSKPKPCP